MEGERDEDGEGRTRVSMYEYLPCFPLFDITMTMAWKMCFLGGAFVCPESSCRGTLHSLARALLSHLLYLHFVNRSCAIMISCYEFGKRVFGDVSPQEFG